MNSKCPLTCELEGAAQRALGWSQQRQAGVFGLRVLQTLHQRDGRVLHKLHQQLRAGRHESAKNNNQPNKQTYRWKRCTFTSGLDSSSSESMGHPVWNLHDNKVTLLHERRLTGYDSIEWTEKEIYLDFDQLNVGFSVGHKSMQLVISEPKPSRTVRSNNRIKRRNKVQWTPQLC